MINQAEKGETIDILEVKPDNAKPSDIDGIPAWRIQQVSKAAQLPEGEYQHVGRLVQGNYKQAHARNSQAGRSGPWAKVQRVEESMYPVVAEGFVPVDDDEPLPF